MVNGQGPVDAVLVGYDNAENLGLRSILAYLQTRGQTAVLLAFRPGDDARILQAVLRWRPRLVGFSLIFQHTLDEFGRLMRHLREGRVAAHFTAGGHFPSLRPEQALELLPELDSIVRFEGELTLSELLERLDCPARWEEIQGLAFRRDRGVVLTPPRPLICDLDSLPPVWRDEPQRLGCGVKVASMLASRGCLFNCSFCSIRQFYGSPSGPLRRVRAPRAVVDEMLALFAQRDVRFFSFQDDDFAARTVQQRAWLHEFMRALAEAGLAERVRWKISCRVDDLDAEMLEALQRHGLAAVYLGVESGSEAGLRALNKQVSVAQNLVAVELLKRCGVAMSMGFMLFDPSSTMETIAENLDFLEAVGADGYFPITFCKMLPYAGTPIEAELHEAGRLEGPATAPDYRFDDPQVDWYEFLVKRVFTRRNFRPDGNVARLQAADFDCRVARAFGDYEVSESNCRSLQGLIGRSNALAVETLRSLRHELLSHGIDYLLEEEQTLVALAEREWRGEAAIDVELARLGQFQPMPPTSMMVHHDRS